MGLRRRKSVTGSVARRTGRLSERRPKRSVESGRSGGMNPRLKRANWRRVAAAVAVKVGKVPADGIE